MKPNVIVIVVDALRARNLSLYGYHRKTSPFLDKLALKGLIFDNFYSTTDQTDPSFTTIFSGRHPLTHGLTRHGPDVMPEHIGSLMATSTTTLASMLSKLGYMTVGLDWLGRWHRRGYMFYGEPHELVDGPRGISARSTRIAAARAKLLALIPTPGLHKKLARLLYGLMDAASYFDAATRILKTARRPFFLSIHLWDVHTPLDIIPKAYLKIFYHGGCSETVESMASRIRDPTWRRLVLNYHLKGIKCIDEIEPRYDAAIRMVDRMLSDFYEGLEDAGLAEETLITITADHGDNLVRDGVFIGHGGLFQRVLKVPLIMVGAGIESQGRVNFLAQHVDLVPTILDVVGALDEYRRYHMDGSSLLRIAAGEEEPKSFIISVSSTARERLMIADHRYKLVYSPSREAAMDKFGGIWFRNTIELYDLDRDHDDREDLSDSMLDVRKELERRLIRERRRMMRNRMKLISSKISRTMRSR